MESSYIVFVVHHPTHTTPVLMTFAGEPIAILFDISISLVTVERTPITTLSAMFISFNIETSFCATAYDC